MNKLLIVTLSFICVCFQCSTGTSPGIAKITVVNPDNDPIPGATVTLKDQSNKVIGSGRADLKGVFSYQQDYLGEQVLEVLVESGDHELQGMGIIRLDPNETTELTIMVE